MMISSRPRFQGNVAQISRASCLIVLERIHVTHSCVELQPSFIIFPAQRRKIASYFPFSIRIVDRFIGIFLLLSKHVPIYRFSERESSCPIYDRLPSGCCYSPALTDTCISSYGCYSIDKSCCSRQKIRAFINRLIERLTRINFLLYSVAIFPVKSCCVSGLCNASVGTNLMHAEFNWNRATANSFPVRATALD